MAILDEYYKRIKEEIANDPDKLGYAGKTDKEIMDLMNSPIIKERVVQDITEPPIYRILKGVAFAPNVLTSEQEITSAKAVI